MLRKSLVFKIKKIQTNKTFMASKYIFNAHLGVLWAISLDQSSSLSPFNLIKQKPWFEIFSRFIRNQTYRILLFLHISLAIQPNFRNWHKFFYNRSGSNKILALPISNFLVYRLHGNIDHLKIIFNQTSIFFQKLV